MKEYYYDTWLEDGTSPIGYRHAGWLKPERSVRRKFNEVQPGAALPAFEQGPVTRTDIVKYAGASWDFNPVHHDETFAKKARSGSIIAHGMMMYAYLGRLATAYLGTAEFDRFSARFVDVTRAGDTLRIEGRVEKVVPHARGGEVVLSLQASKQSGELVATGQVTATLPD